jgi:hypothetical protein
MFGRETPGAQALPQGLLFTALVDAQGPYTRPRVLVMCVHCGPFSWNRGYDILLTLPMRKRRGFSVHRRGQCSGSPLGPARPAEYLRRRAGHDAKKCHSPGKDANERTSPSARPGHTQSISGWCRQEARLQLV